MIKEALEKRNLPIPDRGTFGECRYLSRQGGKWYAPATILRRNYSVKDSEKDLFNKGKTNILVGLHKPRKREVTPDSQGGLGT